MAKQKILVVDDEEDILELLRFNLTKEGFAVVCAASGEEALKSALSNRPDLILLDLLLPGMDGLEVARRLKHDASTKEIPVIMVTAKGEEADIVTGLEVGAEDYITKPFSRKVLIARVRAVLRRKAAAPADDQEVLSVDDLTIHPGRREVLVKGKPIPLTFTEFGILNFLARRPGWVFTRSQIVDAVKGDEYFVTDRAVDVQIVGLRKKLGSASKIIETVRGVGYRFKE
jgi:two-component system alkaline phosphatase synthesis response regulator PhoP